MVVRRDSHLDNRPLVLDPAVNWIPPELAALTYIGGAALQDFPFRVTAPQILDGKLSLIWGQRHGPTLADLRSRVKGHVFLPPARAYARIGARI